MRRSFYLASLAIAVACTSTRPPGSPPRPDIPVTDALAGRSTPEAAANRSVRASSPVSSPTGQPGNGGGSWPGEAAPRIDLARLERIDVLVQEAIARHQLPGAVVLVGQRDTVVYFKAFGHRALVPAREAMTPDTVFDLASLTKVVATTPSVMHLLEQGLVRLDDPVAKYIPEFARNGKAAITLKHLLTHTSGLRPDLDLNVAWHGTAEAVARACDETPVARPGERVQYSDINFLLLGEVVKRVSGISLDRFSRARIFEPLGMGETMFNPPSSLWPRVAPTMPDTETVGGAPPHRQVLAPAARKGRSKVSRSKRRGRPHDEGRQSRGEAESGPMLRGRVHDLTARRMEGVAGHAGLFGTAADLSRFCRMMLHQGALEGVRVLSPLTVARMTSRATSCEVQAVRGLGWDMDSSLSGNRGDLFPPGSYGHSGFTGTSLWIDPSTGVYVVFLSSRLHPDGTGDVRALRSQVATVVAGAIGEDASPEPVVSEPVVSDPAVPEAAEPHPAMPQPAVLAPAVLAPAMPHPAVLAPAVSVPAVPGPAVLEVLSGLDVLRESSFAALRGHRVGLLTNQTGRARDGQSTIDLLRSTPDVHLAALFSPEHGIRGEVDDRVASSRDERSGLPIFSLYGATRRPTDEMLQGIDTLVIDLQDAGARFYTYPATVGYMLEAAARHHIAVLLLDRPDPITGGLIEGPMLDKALEGFTGYLPMPIRHGLTLGELARLFNGERKLGVDLTVVPMRAWRRTAWFDETGLPWTAPSPNLRNLIAATLYPGIGGIEGTRLSVDRGTDTPFEQVGAPWIDAVQLSAALNARQLAGARFYPVSFTPSTGRFARELCHGVFILVTDRNRLEPVRVGLEIASMLHRLYPGSYQLAANPEPLLGSSDTQARVLAGEDPEAIAASWRAGEEEWRHRIAPYLLYGVNDAGR